MAAPGGLFAQESERSGYRQTLQQRGRRPVHRFNIQYTECAWLGACTSYANSTSFIVILLVINDYDLCHLSIWSHFSVFLSLLNHLLGNLLIARIRLLFINMSRVRQLNLRCYWSFFCHRIIEGICRYSVPVYVWSIEAHTSRWQSTVMENNCIDSFNIYCFIARLRLLT